MPRKKNYLNNKDLLKQIHLSKNTFCKFRDKTTDNMYDIIIDDLSLIDDELLETARFNRHKRLTKTLGMDVELDDITNDDIVIRLMTSEHIPLVPKHKQPPRIRTNEETINDMVSLVDPELSDSDPDEDIHAVGVIDGVEMVPMKCGFPPFFHYRVDKDNKPFLVGKSHWKGDLNDGEFCMTHGIATNELGMMYIKLCEKFASRANWRGYSYIDEMKSQAITQLAQVGLQFNEFKSDNPFAYFTTICNNSFTRILNNEKRVQDIRDDILEMNGLEPSWTRQMKNEEFIEDHRKARFSET